MKAGEYLNIGKPAWINFRVVGLLWLLTGFPLASNASAAPTADQIGTWLERQFSSVYYPDNGSTAAHDRFPSLTKSHHWQVWRESSNGPCQLKSKYLEGPSGVYMLVYRLFFLDLSKLAGATANILTVQEEGIDGLYTEKTQGVAYRFRLEFSRKVVDYIYYASADRKQEKKREESKVAHFEFLIIPTVEPERVLNALAEYVKVCSGSSVEKIENRIVPDDLY